MDLKQNLSSQLAALRRAKGQSLDQASEAIGISRSTLQDIEKARGSTRLDTVEEIARGYRIDPLLLLRSEDREQEYRLREQILSTLIDLERLPEPRRRAVVEQYIRLMDTLFLAGDDEAEP